MMIDTSFFGNYLYVMFKTLMSFLLLIMIVINFEFLSFLRIYMFSIHYIN